MKDKLSTVAVCFLIIIFLPFILLYFIIYTPVDIIRYRKTQYYKDTKDKYTWLAAKSYCVRLYEAVKKAGLPIEYYRRGKCFGYFLYKNYLIFNDYNLSYGEEIHYWTVERGDEYIRLEEAVKQDIQDFNEFMKTEAAGKAIILVENDIFDDDPPKSETYEIIITQEDMATALKKFVSEHP